MTVMTLNLSKIIINHKCCIMSMITYESKQIRKLYIHIFLGLVHNILNSNNDSSAKCGQSDARGQEAPVSSASNPLTIFRKPRGLDSRCPEKCEFTCAAD